MPSLSNWLKLPKEIFVEIMLTVGLESLESLRNCRLVCKSWNVLIKRNIWKKIDTRIERNWAQGEPKYSEKIIRTQDRDNEDIFEYDCLFQIAAVSSDTVVAENYYNGHQKGLRIVHKNERVWTLKEADATYSFIEVTRNLLLFRIRRGDIEHVEVYDLMNHSKLMSHAVKNVKAIKCDGSYILVHHDKLDMINVADKSSFTLQTPKFKIVHLFHFRFPQVLMKILSEDEEHEISLSDIDGRNRVINERSKLSLPHSKLSYATRGLFVDPYIILILYETSGSLKVLNTNGVSIRNISLHSMPEIMCHDANRLVLSLRNGSVKVYNLHDLFREGGWEDDEESDGMKAEEKERMKPRTLNFSSHSDQNDRNTLDKVSLKRFREAFQKKRQIK